MAQFKVLRPIEHNGKVFLPEASRAPASSKSAGNGQDIPVDAGGVIELSERQAAELKLGQIEAIKVKVTGEKEQGAGKRKS